MRKISVLFVCMICSIFGITSVKATETVNVYLFSGSTCSFCAAERTFLREIQDEYPYMHVIEYEVWEHPDNAELHEKVKERLGSSSKGVPFLVIGDQSFTGYDEARETDIRNALESYETEEAPDIVQEVIDGVSEEEKETYESQELTEDTSSNNIDWQNIIIGGVIIIAMVFVIYLYYNSKKVK